MPMLDCCAPATLDDLREAIARGEENIALSAEQLSEWAPGIVERHDHVYHSRELELRPLTPKAIHVFIRNEDSIRLPEEIVVLIESERGTIPVPIVRAHRNEPQPKGDA